MLIPTAISLIIATILLNFNLLANQALLTFGQSEPANKAGKVLGISEISNNKTKIFIEPNNDLNSALAKAIDGAKSFPAPRLAQLPQLDQPMRLLPKIQADQPTSLATSELKPADEQKSAITSDDFPAENGVILDYNSDSLFFAKRPDRPWPIASITKLFTAYTFLDHNPGWETNYEIRAEDKREGGRIYLFSGDQVTVKDLFYFSLVGSDNTATAALVRTTGLSEAEFVEKINGKIKELGLKNTRIVEPVGLKDGNISTAREIALFAKIALANEEISRASLTKIYEFKTKQGRKKVIATTDELLSSFPAQGISILGGKTGYVNASGYCLVGQFKNDEGQAIITVVLGADSDNSRFSLTRRLVDLYYKNKP